MVIIGTAGQILLERKTQDSLSSIDNLKNQYIGNVNNYVKQSFQQIFESIHTMYLVHAYNLTFRELKKNSYKRKQNKTKTKNLSVFVAISNNNLNEYTDQRSLWRTRGNFYICITYLVQRSAQMAKTFNFLTLAFLNGRTLRESNSH